MNGARGTLVAAPPGAPAVPQANGFHSHKAGGLPREANGLIHPGTGQGTRPTASFILAQGNALGHPAQQTTQPEGLPHHPAIRRPTPMKQAFSLPSIYHLFPQGAALG
jgi:hypothetical protein